MKKRILFTIAYDGTEYAGWQKQKYDSVKTVQGTLECACKKLFGQQYIEIIGASRTDAGVHAMGQRAVIDVETSIPVKKIPFAIRSLLPDEMQKKWLKIFTLDMTVSKKQIVIRFILMNFKILCLENIVYLFLKCWIYLL